jgi:hypothetical protein
MSESSPDVAASSLELLPYHRRIVEFLKRHDPDVWNWFAATKTRTSQADELKFDLLKSTYRIDRDSQPSLYETAERAAAALGLSVPITIYQAQDPAGLNASLAYLPGEAHLVLHGPVTAQLTPVELAGLLGHELTHFHLCEVDGGALLIAAEILAALTHDSNAHPAHFASWRLLRLYNEIVCDRGALRVTGDMRSVVSMLVKVHTGVGEINPDSYFKQADEIFAHGPAKTEGITHPEVFVRARAIRLWADVDPQANLAITGMIEAAMELRELDLLGQEAVAGWTRRMIDLLLSPKWIQSDPMVSHARLYFDDYSPPTNAIADPNLAGEMRLDSQSLRDYFCFVLLDFVAADRDLDEPSLAAVLSVAEQLGLKERFIELVRQELRLRKSQIEKVDDRKGAILQEADRSTAEAT